MVLTLRGTLGTGTVDVVGAYMGWYYGIADIDGILGYLYAGGSQQWSTMSMVRRQLGLWFCRPPVQASPAQADRA